jgi:GNAT superfamily N-acetyltransferase
MYTPILVETAEQRERFCALAGLDPLTPDTLSGGRADAHWMLAAGAAIVARCSLWWKATPAYQEHRLGLIGHYAATDMTSAGALLRLAGDQLAAHGCTLAVGPMDGSTHQRYRLLTERGAEPLFFLEPDNPDAWPAHFTDNGFDALAHYYSALVTHLEHHDVRLPAIAARLAAEGVRIRALDARRFEAEVRAIYGLVVASFHDNVLYSSITEADFVEQYRQIAPFVRPELVLLAEREDRPVGFLFAIPDWLQARHGQPIDTIVVKTIAVLPAYAGLGLGTLLGARCQEIAHRLGYTRAILALMHERNRSRSIGSHYDPQVIRRYTLFARTLVPRP